MDPSVLSLLDVLQRLLLQVIERHELNAVRFGTVNVVLVRKNADGHPRARKLGELDGTGETLVALRIVVLQADLKLNCLDEIPPVLLRGGKKVLDGTPHA